jgi:hypothetical protein
MIDKLIFTAAIAAATGAMAPAATAAVQWGVTVNIAPPVPMLVVAPPPRPGYVWVPGYWGWSNGRHVWLNGSWLRERPGYAYWQPRWVERDGRWWLERGQWARGDRDRDGIPNRRDGDRDGDGVPNRRDGDRDGDGVPNRYDRHGKRPQPQ